MDRTRIRIGVGLLLAVAAMIFLFCWLRRDSARMPQDGSSPAWAKTNVVTSPAIEQGASNSAMGDGGPAPAKSQARLPIGRNEQMRAAAEAQNVPIKFWGKIVDQDNRPLQGVRLKMSVRQWYLLSHLNPDARFLRFERQSGPDGLFELTEGTGDVMTIDSIEKPGYTVSSKVRKTFGYNVSTNFQPNLAKPFVIKMWMNGEKQDLRSHQLNRIGIPCDGEPVFLDLFAGKRVLNGGDLKVSFTRQPLHLPPGILKYDWRIEIQALDGGLQPSSDEFMYLAPDNGYQERFSLAMQKDDANWVPQLDREFYVRLRDGKYFGRMALHLSTHYEPPPTGLTIDIAINPTGSRNLEGTR